VLFLDYVTMPVVHFIAFETLGFLWMFVRFRLLAPVWHRAFIAVLFIVVVVNMAVKILRTMKPRARSDEHAAHKPFGTVIAVRGTGIWSIVIVTVGTFRGHPNIDTDLGLYSGRIYGEAESSYSE
jgi:hypothetical protein